MKKRKQVLAILLLSAALAATGCSTTLASGTSSEVSQDSESSTDVSASSDSDQNQSADGNASEDANANVGNNETADAQVNSQFPGGAGPQGFNSSGSSVASTALDLTTILDFENMFSDRDLEQEADLSEAQNLNLESGKDITITEEGVYVISGTATDCTIIVEADDTAKVQLVLDGVSITNTDFPAIYVKNADKVFVTTTSSSNTLTVSGTFTADGETNTDAVIFSKDDIVFNGTGTLTINSSANGITCKNDVKFTGGTYTITSAEDAIEAGDSIRVCDGSFTIKSEKDALHSEDSDDDTTGYVYISGGSFDIDAADDGIQATTYLVIDGGTIDVNAAEALEGTYIQINDGTINIYATDDGINASTKCSTIGPVIEITGGDITIEMASGDTDALDANGALIITGGNIDITAQFAFDYDSEATFTGGTITVNGEEVTEITESMMMGGGGFGGRGGMGQMNGQNGTPPEGEMNSQNGMPPEGNNQQFGAPPQDNQNGQTMGREGKFNQNQQANAQSQESAEQASN